MIQISRVGEAITGTVNRKHFGVSFSEAKYNAMLEVQARANAATSMEELQPILAEFEALTQESYKEVVETISPYLVVNTLSNRFYLRYKAPGTTTAIISKYPMPKAFADRIIESVEKKIDPKPYVLLWVRFLRNPKFNENKAEKLAWYISQTYTDPKNVDKLIKDGMSSERANELSTGFQTPVTPEGLLCTYKVSKEITEKFVKDDQETDGVKKVGRYDYEVDEFTGLKKYNEPKHVEDRYYQPAVMGTNGDGFFCKDHEGNILYEADKNHIIRVGYIHQLKDWNQVNCDDNKSCVPGLHVGNLDYIRSYQNEGTVTHEVLVDPMDIGAIVQDGTGAIRVKAYFVYRSFQGATRSLYHSSEYAKLKDSEYDDMVKQAVEKTMADAQQAQIIAAEDVAQAQALAGNPSL